MTRIDDLIARSRAPGTFVEQRTFTLARTKAVEKMREFSLYEPSAAVLELIQSANLANARIIAVDASHTELMVGWVGGRAFSRNDLENLFDHLFLDQADADRRYLMQLAVGVNGVLQRKPLSLTIESGDGSAEGTTRVEISSDVALKVGRPRDQLDGTYLHARFRRAFLSRIFDQGMVRESAWVEASCSESPAPIVVNGTAPIGLCRGQGYVVMGAREVQRFDVPEAQGILGVGDIMNGVRIVIGGVQVTRKQVFDERIGGVIASNQLRKTADMSTIVEDERWAQVLHALVPIGRKLLGPAWRATDLPPKPNRVDEAPTSPGANTAPRGPAREPVPDPIPQVNPRVSVPIRQVVDPAYEGEPVFFVEQASEPMITAVDPAIFPYRVLILTQGQAATLADDLPQLARLTQAQDVTFVQQALARHAVVHTLTLRGEALDAALELRRDVDPASLDLRLHLTGHAPRWDGASPRQGAPMLVWSGGATRRCDALPIDLPNVSAILRLDARVDTRRDITEATLARLARVVRSEIWRLLPHDVERDERGGQLVLALLNTFARPTFERDPATGRTRLDVHLPTAWGEARRTFLDAPIVEAVDGPVSLSELVALQGTDRARTLTDPAAAARIARLEQRFGHGHLLVEGIAVQPLAIAGRIGPTWHDDLDLERIEAADELVLLRPTIASMDVPEDWRARPDPAPFLAHWVRCEASEQNLSGGLRALAHRLDLLERAGARADLPRHDLIVVARLHLARLLDQPYAVRLSTTHHRTHTAMACLRDPAIRVSATGGVNSRESGVVPLTYAGLCALEQLAESVGHPHAISLLRDDHPDLWATPDAQPWLVREPIHSPYLTGWLGLRLPFDATPAVLLEGPDGAELLTAMTTQIPCAGVLRTQRSRPLTDAQIHALRLAAMRLYEQLTSLLDPEIDAHQAEAARSYIGRFLAIQLLFQPRRPLEGLARTLADRTRLPPPAERWTILRWAEADPDARPELPSAWTHGLVPPQPRRGLPDHYGTKARITTPVAEELSAQRGRALSLHLRVDPTLASYRATSDDRYDTVYVDLPEHDPDVARLLSKEHLDEITVLRMQLQVVGAIQAHFRGMWEPIDAPALAIALVSRGNH